MTHQSIRALPPIREARFLFLMHVRLNPRLYPMKSVSVSFWRNYVGVTCPWRRTRIRISSRKWKAVTAAPFDRHMPINRGMTYEQMLDAVENQPVHVIEATLDDDTSGLYCEAIQTIIIDEHMTDVQKRCSLTHELFHWLHADDSHAEYGKSHAEWRVRRETAMFLIDPADYVQAEREYDGEIYQMSCEMDVTVFLLEDYRRILEYRQPIHD